MRSGLQRAAGFANSVGSPGLDVWQRPPLCVPESENLNLAQARSGAIVEVISNPREVDSTHALEASARHLDATRRLLGDEVESGGEIVTKSIRHRRAVDPPPLGRTLDLSRGAARDDNWERHAQRDRRRRSSAAERTSPRSASAID